MMALSLWEPWASAIAYGFKSCITRPQALDFRGPLAICSTKRKMEKPERDLMASLKTVGEFEVAPLGSILCVTQMVDCIPSSIYLRTHQLEPLDATLGYYGINRFIFKTNPRALRRLKNPVPVGNNNNRNFFYLAPDVEAKVREQL